MLEAFNDEMLCKICNEEDHSEECPLWEKPKAKEQFIEDNFVTHRLEKYSCKVCKFNVYTECLPIIAKLDCAYCGEKMMSYDSEVILYEN